MNQWYCSVCHEKFSSDNKPGKCKVCHADDRMIMNIEQVPQSLEQVRDMARKKLKGICAVRFNHADQEFGCIDIPPAQTHEPRTQLAR